MAVSEIPDNYTSRTEIMDRFEALDEVLENDARLVLIGGGAMTFQGIKDGTKDLDLVATSKNSYKRVRGALLELGLEEVDHPEKSYASLGAISVLEFGEDNRVDLFDRQVMGKLTVSETMVDRCQGVFSGSSLTVSMLAPVDIALFKSMTPRENDLTDVERLLASGIDMETYEHELRTQLPLNYGFDEFEWIIGAKRHPLIQLEETFRNLDALPVTLTEYVASLAAKAEAEAVVVNWLRTREAASLEELRTLAGESYVSETKVDEAIGRLVKKDLLVNESDDTIRLVIEPDDEI